MRKALLLLVVLAGFVAGCESKYKDPDPKAMGYDYYPLEIGDYRVYNVTDTRYSSNVGTTTRFQLRERVDTSFIDQTGQLVYKVVRSRRPNEQVAWLDDSVMVVAKTSSMVLLTKDNTKYVKMVFPVKQGTRWQADVFNNRSVDNSKEYATYTDLNTPFEYNDRVFQSTVTVIQGSPFDNVQLDDRKEVYAENIGLVYRLFNRAVYCEGSSSSSSCQLGVSWKESGHERHEVLIDHGKL
jgi:hypothetical protein